MYGSRYCAIALHDAVTDHMLQELMATIQHLTQQNRDMEAALQHDYGIISTWSSEKLEYQKHLKNLQAMKRALAENPFVMILIDGDGMIVIINSSLTITASI